MIRESEGVLNDLVQTGYPTTEPNERSIRLLSNSRRSQSEKLAGEQGPGDRSKEAA